MPGKEESSKVVQVEVPRHLFTALRQATAAADGAVIAAQAAGNKAQALIVLRDALVAAVIKDGGHVPEADFSEWSFVEEADRAYIRAKKPEPKKEG